MHPSQNLAMRALRLSRGARLRYPPCRRAYATAPAPLTLKETLKEVIPEKRELLAKLKVQSKSVIGEVTVENALGGMRGLTALVWEGSVLDPNEGIRFHGRTIADCQAQLPRGRQSSVMLPEAMFWLLLTGRIPSEAQITAFSLELAHRFAVPQHVFSALHRTQPDTHPMAQLAAAVTLMSNDSEFARAYHKGMEKANYWEPVFEDCVSLIAQLPNVAGTIYGRDPQVERKRGPGKHVVHVELSQDWAQRFAAKLGYGGPENRDFQDLLRLYLALHADHEGGNVSAHATHLVGSALSDPFLSYAAGLNGLAGPLHGLAAQNVLRFLQEMTNSVPAKPTEDQIAGYLRQILGSGRIIPGYGHGVLRQPDPRFQTLVDFGASRPGIAADPLFQMVQRLSQIAPVVLKEHGKTKNPFPNVDAMSGVLFHHFGLTESLHYTVIFGVSRALGALAQLIWSRILGFPIERPKSIDMKGLLQKAEKSK